MAPSERGLRARRPAVVLLRGLRVRGLRDHLGVGRADVVEGEVDLIRVLALRAAGRRDEHVLAGLLREVLMFSETRPLYDVAPVRWAASGTSMWSFWPYLPETLVSFVSVRKLSSPGPSM